jgi:hypothetical protein
MKKMLTAILLTLLLALNYAIAGCLEEENGEKEDLIIIELMGDEHKIYAGDSTTYVLLVRNNRDENDTITLSVADKPEGWVVTLNNTEFNVTKNSRYGVFLQVNSSQSANKGNHRVKIEGLSDVDDKKYSKTITTKVIEEDDTVVEEGDNVEVDYVGYLGEFVIFDTTVQDIGRERTVRKTPEFALGKTFEPLNVFTGSEDTDTSDDYIKTIDGFWEGLVGMSEGQSRTVVIPPTKGYGVFVNVTVNVTEEVVMTEILTFADFRSYYDEALIEGITVKHHFWGWNVSIDYVNETEDVVRLINEPHLNETSSPYNWESMVIYKNQSDHGGEGRILVQHDTQVGHRAIYKGFDADVTAIEDGQITLFYNRSGDPLGTQILLFDITLIKIAE